MFRTPNQDVYDMANFCTNCGTRIGKDDNFCTNCGMRIDKSDMKHDSSSNSKPDINEIKKAEKELKRVIGGRFSYNQSFLQTLADNGINTAHNRLAIREQVQNEIESGKISSGGVEFRVNQLIVEYRVRMERIKEEENRKLKRIDEILDSIEITSEIRKIKNNETHIYSIKNNLKEKLISKKEIRSEDEIRRFIKGELEKITQEEQKARNAARQTIITQEKPRTGNVGTGRKMQENQKGGYCDYSCIHYTEEYISSDGELGYDFTGAEIIDHYCNLGHLTPYGSFCKYYESHI